MSDVEIGLLILVALPIIIILIFSFISIIDSIKMKGFKKKYPELFELIEIRNEKQTNHCGFWNDNIAPKINKIDYIIKEQKYMSAKSLEQSNIELEELRVEVEKLKEEYNEISKETEMLLEQIESIIKTDKSLLKIMKARGWCRGEYE